MAIMVEGSGRYYAARHRSVMIARALFSFVLSMAILSSACSRQESGSDSKAELLWQYLAIDSVPAIHKFGKLPLRVLFVVDEDQVDRFTQSTKNLLGAFSIKTPLKFELCFAVAQQSSNTLQYLEESCTRGSFDIYFFVPNGTWSDVQWRQTRAILSGWSLYLFDEMREAQSSNDKAGGKWFCQSKTQLDSDNVDIVGAISVIQTQNDRELSVCFATTLLMSVGVYPFDGGYPLKITEESDTVAHFILKDSPYGAAYLVKRLYADELKSGMSYTDAVRYLRDKE